MQQKKCLEYYLDSKIYNNEEIQKNIEETKKEFPKKKIRVDIQLNSFGMYIITFYFENRESIFHKIKVYFKKKKNNKILLLQEKNDSKIENKTTREDKTKKRLEKYYGQKYGQYKKTQTYRPY